MLGFELLSSIIYGRFVSSENLYPVKTVEQVEIVISIDMTGWKVVWLSVMVKSLVVAF